MVKAPFRLFRLVFAVRQLDTDFPYGGTLYLVLLLPRTDVEFSLATSDFFPE